MSSPVYAIEARERYRRQVNQAQIGDLLSLVTGSDTDLISYHDVANRLKARQQIEMGTHMIPVERIVGSVGPGKKIRYTRRDVAAYLAARRTDGTTA